MEITIHKFGGSSVGNSEAIQNVVNRVLECRSETKIVVLSAIYGVTDMLISTAELAVYSVEDSLASLEKIYKIHIEIIDQLGIKQHTLISEIDQYFDNLNNLIIGINYISELTNKIKDNIIAFGELLSTLIVSYYFKHKDINCKLYDSRQFIKTDSNYSYANIDYELSIAAISNIELEPNTIYILQGFIASDINNTTTTLGRGGSDYTASILGYLLQHNNYDIKSIIIWKDVDGIMTTDPKIDKNAEIITQISYDDVLKLTYFGAKILHPNSIKPAIENSIPVIINNTFKANNRGTTILKNATNNQIIKIKLNNSKMIELYNLDQTKLIEYTNKILNILISTKSTIISQFMSVYSSTIIFKTNNINIEDYIYHSHYKLRTIDLTAIISSDPNFNHTYRNIIRGSSDSIYLILDE